MWEFDICYPINRTSDILIIKKYYTKSVYFISLIPFIF
nr:MAG TPA: hypothetical protein [Bacteriophage sp.]